MLVLKLFHNFNKLHHRNIHKLNIKMDQAFFRYLDGEEHYDLLLKYTNPTLKVDRQFNFKRQINEPISTLLTRISTNINKITTKKSKRKKTETDLPNLSIDLLNEKNESIEKSQLCKKVFLTIPKLKLKIDEVLIEVNVNTPWVEKIELPKSILSGFPVYPSLFEAICTIKSLSDFTWSKNGVAIGKGFTYMAKIDDIGAKLKLNCIPKNEKSLGPEVEIEAAVPVEAGPGFCPFETRHQFTQNQLSGKEFRVVSYNILADYYCDSDYTRNVLFPYCPAYALELDYRKHFILKELIGYNSDIICLQEVDEKMFNLELLPVFSEFGLDGVFHRKGTVTEGLSVMFNKNRFKLNLTKTVNLGIELPNNEIFKDLWKLVDTNTKFCERILPRSTSLQYTILEAIDGNNEVLVVANTHLYFHPDADHVRLFQAGIIIQYLSDVMKKTQMNYPNQRVTLILCGDFNSIPSCGIYQLMTTGHVSSACIDWQSNQEESPKNVNLSQPFRLSSACGTPEYTNFTAGFAACLDYIFYEEDKLSVTQVVPFPSDEELKANVALPSIVFPSDHLALISDLKWT